MSYRRKGNISSLAQDAQALTGTKDIGAGAETEEEILLPNMPEGILPGIIQVEIEDELGDYFDAAGDYIKWSLSGKSQDAVLGCGDPDCIMNDIYENQVITAMGTQRRKYVYVPPAPVKVSYKKIYLQLKSTFAATVHYRIWWVPRASPTPQRDNLVSQTQF